MSNPSATVPNDQPFDFLGLPGEIRNLVYKEYALDTLHLTTSKTQSVSWVHLDRKSLLEVNDLALLLVNKQIRCEVDAILDKLALRSVSFSTTQALDCEYPEERGIDDSKFRSLCTVS